MVSSRLAESYISTAFLPRQLKKSNYRFPMSTQTAFNMAFCTDLNFYDFCDTVDREMDESFNRAMISFSRPHLAYLRRNYHFSHLDSRKGVVIDVGGGLGQVSIYLMNIFPNLRFIVQDRENVLEQSRQLFNLGVQSSDRLTLMAHNFFLQQPSREILGIRAEQPIVYLLKHIVHNCDNETCLRLLNPIAKALKSHDRLLLYDIVLDSHGDDQPMIVTEARLSASLINLSIFGGRYRNESDFRHLFSQIDPPLMIYNVSEERDSMADSMRVIEAGLGESKY
jgi:hypothetical protein